MKVIIAGSRSITGKLKAPGTAIGIIEQAVRNSGFRITEVVSGTAAGVDRFGEDWASRREIPVRRFPAEWGRFGRNAGFRRNVEMAKYADGLIAIWDGESAGTRHMIGIAKGAGLPVFVERF